jgi:hypothetical protein
VTRAPVAVVTQPEPEDRRSLEQPRRRRLPSRWRPPVQPLFLLVFVGLAMWRYLPVWASPATKTLQGGDGDPAIFMWFLRWVPFALEHGHDLLVTHYLNYPDGVNLMWNTSLPLPGLLLAPVTEAWGPVLSFNLLLVLMAGAQLLIGEELLAMAALLGFAMLLLVVAGNLRRLRAGPPTSSRGSSPPRSSSPPSPSGRCRCCWPAPSGSTGTSTNATAPTISRASWSPARRR